MGTSLRTTPLPLKTLLLGHTHEFSFVQGVYLTKRLAEIEDVRSKIKFKSRIFLSLPPAEIHAIVFPKSPSVTQNISSNIQIHVNFLGIAGIQGPLPLPYTELLIQRIRKKDISIIDFLDIFNNRFINLYFSIQKKYQPTLQTCSPEASTYGRCLANLLGFPWGQNEIGTLTRRHMLAYASFLWKNPHCVINLQSILENFLGVKVWISSFEGRWIDLSAGQKTYLSSKRSNTTTLGQGLPLGQRVFSSSQTIGVHFEIKNRATYDKFLPGGSIFMWLQNFLKFYLGPSLSCRLYLTLKLRTPSVLSRQKSPVWLGWTSWLSSHKKIEKVGKDLELVFDFYHNKS